MGPVTARLPGIRIDTVPLPPTTGLPPMDVAVFVGFAATGPVHRPVAIEGLAQYQTVFGGDLALAFDLEQGERLYANLGPAVRSFFSNGGRRCWVIRVARTPALESAWSRVAGRAPIARETAVANRFAVPGVLALAGEGPMATLAPAQVQARSLGSWSDPLQVAAALLSARFTLTDCAAIGSPPGMRIGLRTTASLMPGDLIALGEGAGAAAARSSGAPQVFAIIERRVPLPENGSALTAVEATLCAAFEPLTVGTGSPLNSPIAPAQGMARLPGAADSGVPARIEVLNTSSGLSPVVRLHLDGTAPSASVEGHWLRWSDPDRVIWIRADRRVIQAPADGAQTTATAFEGPAWRELPAALLDPAPTQGAVLTLDLRVRNVLGDAARLSGLGLTPSHPAAWWRQVSDDRFYTPAADQSGFGPAGGATNTAPARVNEFPLSALDQETGAAVPRAWIPLGVEALFGPALGPLPQGAGALERDGLARFDAELFLDPDLALSDTATLMDQADSLRYVADERRDLFGIHAALGIADRAPDNEASLIAVPDAVQPGWMPGPRVDPPPPRPEPPVAPAHWATHRGPCARNAAHPSATAPDFGHFLDVWTRRLRPPVLEGPATPVPPGSFSLAWEASEPGATYVLEESHAADLQNAREVYRGPDLSFRVQATREGHFYYRVTAWSGDERSPASNPWAVAVRDDQWVVQTWAADTGPGAGELLRIHQGLLQLAAASGELFSVLSLPRHFRAPEAIRYAARLRAAFPGRGTADGGGWEERRALSFGALYHPWVHYTHSEAPSTATTARSALPSGLSRICPPDGLAAGVIAARAAGRGAWIAPANEPLKDLVALTPAIDPAAWLPLQEARVNLIRAQARGFVVLAADTLSEEEDWRSINVRRLFSLLRRLALRRGLSYVFEPNGDVLRRAVERGFTGVLTDLYRRGAFAGATADASFQVVTSGAINTALDRDAGRFLVELRVAPALPLRFITVRLLQRGERLTLMEAS